MGPTESVLVAMEFTIARRTHKCWHKEDHLVKSGMPRLTVRNGNKAHHYCPKCATVLLAQSAEHLEQLLTGANRLKDV